MGFSGQPIGGYLQSKNCEEDLSMKAVILAPGNSSSDTAGIFEACAISLGTEFGARIIFYEDQEDLHMLGRLPQMGRVG